MITGKLRSQIDKLWTEFWTGGIANPLTVIEQISFLMFAKLLDITAAREEKKASRTGKKPKSPFDGPDDLRRWRNFKNTPADEMFKIVRDEVFPLFRKIGEKKNGDVTTFGRYMQDSQLMIQKAGLLVSAVNMIDALPLERGDIKGDLYEYMLGKLTTAGISGQFRTPRHIIRLMVDLLQPKPDERIADPACGTAGFLVAVMEYLLENNTSKEGLIPQTDDDGQPLKDDNGKPLYIYTGDKLEPYRKHIQNDMFYGFDFDVSMLRIAAMNMMLHGVENPNIHYQDTLSNSFPDRHPQAANDCFDIILANPPFKGALDPSDVHSSLTGKVKTRKTELLFPTLMLRMLKLGGKCAVIVPDGVLFGSSKAHRDLRQMLVDDNQLDAVIKLPAGVFKPYAGVSTAVLIFTRGGETEHVWYYDVQADGFSLDDKRDPVEANDLPDVRKQWSDRLVAASNKKYVAASNKKNVAASNKKHVAADLRVGRGKSSKPKSTTKDSESTSALKPNPKHFDRKAKAFFVPVADIREAKYDLSINRYKETVYEEPEYDPPRTILAKLKKLNKEEAADLKELEAMLK
jgi:type I restriction enzyme M protein